MEMKVQVPFQELISIVRKLSPTQKAKLLAELSNEQVEAKDGFMEHLLNGPVYSEKDLQIIEENRKSIAAWRTKN